MKLSCATSVPRIALADYRLRGGPSMKQWK